MIGAWFLHRRNFLETPMMVFHVHHLSIMRLFFILISELSHNHPFLSQKYWFPNKKYSFSIVLILLYQATKDFILEKVKYQLKDN